MKCCPVSVSNIAPGLSGFRQLKTKEASVYVGSHKSYSFILLCMEQCRGLSHELHHFRVYVGQACYHAQIVRSWALYALKRVGPVYFPPLAGSRILPSGDSTLFV
jgi:hypothetical protein